MRGIFIGWKKIYNDWTSWQIGFTGTKIWPPKMLPWQLSISFNLRWPFSFSTLVGESHRCKLTKLFVCFLVHFRSNYPVLWHEWGLNNVKGCPKVFAYVRGLKVVTIKSDHLVLDSRLKSHVSNVQDKHVRNNLVM